MIVSVWCISEFIPIEHEDISLCLYRPKTLDKYLSRVRSHFLNLLCAYPPALHPFLIRELTSPLKTFLLSSFDNSPSLLVLELEEVINEGPSFTMGLI